MSTHYDPAESVLIALSFIFQIVSFCHGDLTAHSSHIQSRDCADLEPQAHKAHLLSPQQHEPFSSPVLRVPLLNFRRGTSQKPIQGWHICRAQQQITKCMMMGKTRRTTPQFIHTTILNNLMVPNAHAHVHHARDVSACQTISRLALEHHYPAVVAVSIVSL